MTAMSIIFHRNRHLPRVNIVFSLQSDVVGISCGAAEDEEAFLREIAEAEQIDKRRQPKQEV